MLWWWWWWWRWRCEGWRCFDFDVSNPSLLVIFVVVVLIVIDEQPHARPTVRPQLRRRNFVVEKLHIPPDDGSGGEADAAVTETGAPSATQDGQLAQLLCAPGKSDLDF